MVLGDMSVTKNKIVFTSRNLKWAGRELNWLTGATANTHTHTHIHTHTHLWILTIPKIKGKYAYIYIYIYIYKDEKTKYS